MTGSAMAAVPGCSLGRQRLGCFQTSRFKRKTLLLRSGLENVLELGMFVGFEEGVVSQRKREEKEREGCPHGGRIGRGSVASKERTAAQQPCEKWIGSALSKLWVKRD